MSTIWEDTWEIISERFRQVANSLTRDYPDMTWTCGHGDNESFPFRAYASFNRRGEQEAAVVVSVDFLRRENALHYSSDVSLEEGPVLADGPSGLVKLSTDTALLRKDIQRAVNAIGTFILSSEALIGRNIH